MSSNHLNPSFLVSIPIPTSRSTTTFSSARICSIPMLKHSISTTSSNKSFQLHFSNSSILAKSHSFNDNTKPPSNHSHNTNPNSLTPKRKRPTKKHSTSNFSSYTRAMQLSYRRDKRAARAAFRAAVAENPADARLWLAWAQMESKIKNFNDARSIFQQAVTNHPQNIRLLHAWAISEQRADLLDRADALFRRCIQLNSKDGIVWQSLALLQQQQQDYELARITFQNGIQNDPNNAYLWSTWGVMEQRLENYEKASELFRKAVDIDPTHIRTYQAWAITREKMGLHDESASLFRQALNLNPTNVPTHQAFALFEARRGDYNEARKLFQKGSQLDPSHAPIWHAWAVMEKELGQFDIARELFQKGIEVAPNNTPMLRAWASMELDLGHIDKSSDWTVPRGKRKSFDTNKQKEEKSVNMETVQQPITQDTKSNNINLNRMGKSNSKRDKRQISTVGENLRMLRLMIERRSDEDVTTVMQWLNRRAETDRELYDSIAERSDNDMRKVSKWIERRSASDITAFKQWLGERYEKDRRIGVYIFNWNVPQRIQTPVAIPAKVSTDDVQIKPVEWLQLSEQPKPVLQKFDEEIYCNQQPTDYADGVYFLGQIAEGLADRAALLLVLCAMTLGLVGTTAHLFDKGYLPSGEYFNVEELVPAPPRAGVDADLFTEGGAEYAANESSRRDLRK